MRTPCRTCNYKGLIAVRYRSGEKPDVAICSCGAGESWRARGELAIRTALRLTDDQQVTDIEHVMEEQPIIAVGDVALAARTRKGARL